MSSTSPLPPSSPSTTSESDATTTIVQEENTTTLPIETPSSPPATTTPSSLNENVTVAVESNEPKFEFEISHNKSVYNITMTGDRNVKQLKEEIHKQTHVPISFQKYIFKTKEKPNLKDDNQLIKNLGLVKICKILLMGSSTMDLFGPLNIKKSTTGSSSSASSSNEPSSPVTLKLSQLPEHKKYIDKGIPEHAEKGDKTKELAAPSTINGILNNRGEEIRFTFKTELNELWIQSKSSTEKVPYLAVRNVESESIHSHPEYHIMNIQVGQSPQNKLWFYYIPAQYVRYIKYTLCGIINDFPFF